MHASKGHATLSRNTTYSFLFQIKINPALCVYLLEVLNLFYKIDPKPPYMYELENVHCFKNCTDLRLKWNGITKIFQNLPQICLQMIKFAMYFVKENIQGNIEFMNRSHHVLSKCMFLLTSMLQYK